MLILTSKTWVVRANVSRNRDFGWVGATPTSNGNLGTRNVPLRSSGDMEPDLLDTQEIVARWDGLRNGEGEG